MSEPKKDRAILFNENSALNLCLAEIGHNDFRVKKPLKLFHIRSENIIHYVRNGKGTLDIGENSYSISEGEFFLVPPNIPIKYNPDADDPWRYYWFSLKGDAAPEISAIFNLSSSSPVRKAVSSAKTVQILDELFTNNVSNAQMYYLAFSSLMQIIALSQEKSSISTSSRNFPNVVSNIKEIIELNYNNQEFTIDAIARMLYISHSYMCKVFKEQMHCTPVAYLIDLRLSKAADMISKQNYSVKELCKAVGFNDEPYFMKRFKQKFGMTVKEYRKKAVEGKDVAPPQAL